MKPVHLMAFGLVCHPLLAQWTAAAKPEEAGFSPVRLQAVRRWLEANDTTAMMVIADGKLVFEYGDVRRATYLASARKTLLALLYGKYVQSGAIRLDRTLRQIGIDDVGGLGDRELSATVEDVISARSGVYHPASNEGDATASAPPRGSQPPGSYYLYNNWDFNAAGAIFEKLSGRDIYAAFAEDLASRLSLRPLDQRHGSAGTTDAAGRGVEWRFGGAAGVASPDDLAGDAAE